MFETTNSTAVYGQFGHTL